MAVVTSVNPVAGVVDLVIYAGAPTAATFANVAKPGCLLIDTVNFNLYINAGTQAVPAWKLFTRAA